MISAQRVAEFCKGAFRVGVAGLLCVLMVGQPMVAAAAVKRSAKTKQIQGDVLGEAAYKTLGSRNLELVFPGAHVTPTKVLNFI